PDYTDTGTRVFHALGGQEKSQGHAIACVEKEGKRERIHKRHIQNIQFLADCRTGIVIPAERNPRAGGGELAQKCHDERYPHEIPGSLPTDQPACQEQKYGEEYEYVGTKDNRLQQEV